MANIPAAIDIMYYVATPEFIAKWNHAKEGELICRMERALGGSLPQFPSIDQMLAEMDAANVEQVFITQTKMWSYRNKFMYMDTQLEEVDQYLHHAPSRFIGLAGYNPFRINESLAEIELAVKQRGYKGVYVHIYGFDIGFADAKMYPLYAKCVELGVPVSLQVGHVLEGMPSYCGKPIELDRVACDFPELKILGAHTGWPWVDELISMCYKWENLWFGIDAWLPKYLSKEIVHFMDSRMGRERVVWGTNGLPWGRSLEQLQQIGLKDETIERVVRLNAQELFGLG
jgi:predicted TIM-barrel fold metal-dependent hydrolase